MAPNTSIRGAGANEFTNTLSSSPRRSPCSPYRRIPVRPWASMPRTSSSTAASSRAAPRVPDAPAVPAIRPGEPLLGPDHPPRADLARAGDHRRDRDRLAALDRRGDIAQLGEAGPVDPLDEDVDDPAAGQPHRERIVVAHPVGLEHRVPGLADVQRQLVDGTLDASARHAADDLVVGRGRHRQRRTRITGRAAVRPHHRGQAERLPGLPPLRDPAQDVTHSRHLGS